MDGEKEMKKLVIVPEVGVLTEKQKDILWGPNGLIKYFENERYRKLMISIIKQETKLSLRLLDWLVTNYSKRKNVVYVINSTTDTDEEKDPESGQIFNLWNDYKNQLKAFSKCAFDPFSRRHRIWYNYITNEIMPEGTEITDKKNVGIINTTVGQMNFFRWAITYKVIDYAFNNLMTIEKHMLESSGMMVVDGIKKHSKNSSNTRTYRRKVIITFS